MAMTDFNIVTRSLTGRWFATATTVLTVGVAVGLLLVLTSMRNAGEQAFARGTGNMHLLVSADSSPLNSVLNTVFYAGAPGRKLPYARYESLRADPRVEWASPPIAPAEAGVVVSNELFDAFPVRLFDAGGRGPVEVGVVWNGEAFAEVPLGVVSLDDAPTGGRFEVNQHAYGAMRSLCGLVERGAVLTFDYGYPQEELWAPWRTTGTLLCFYRHTAHENPLIHVGEQDMTTHVNFSELISAVEDEGFAAHGPVRQSEFLLSMGLGALVEIARNDMGEYFARRRALHTLTDAAGLGRVRVLAATRGIEGPLPGFEEAP